VFYLLEAAGFETWLVNAQDVRHLPGRPKTGKLDAVWLCKVAERPMLRPSFVPPPPVRKLRDLTRYRADLVAARTAEKQRAEKLLEDACIKLSAVVSDIFGVSGRDMLAALVAGERDPKALAQLARRSMRAKITVLEEAFTGHFTGHHGFLLGTMLGRVDAISAGIAALDDRIAAEAAPFAAAVSRLDEIPGFSLASAYVILAESGSPGASPRQGPLRTVRARYPGTRLKQAPRALRARVLASCVCGPGARGRRRCVSGGFGSRPACHARPGRRGSRRRSPCEPRFATIVPIPRGDWGGWSGLSRCSRQIGQRPPCLVSRRRLYLSSGGLTRCRRVAQ